MGWRGIICAVIGHKYYRGFIHYNMKVDCERCGKEIKSYYPPPKRKEETL